MTLETRFLLALRSAQDILSRHLEPEGLEAKAAIDTLLTVLDDEEVVEATGDIARPFILQDLYDSEINYTIATFSDAGLRVMLSDDMNGFVAEIRVPTFTEAVQLLALTAMEHY